MSIEGTGHATGLRATTTTIAASDRIAAAVASRVADTARRRQRVVAALDHAEANGHEVSVARITRSAAVHRVFLYRHRDLLDRLRALEAAPPSA